jgi:MYXO-CTERM domain-containing protein
MNKIYLTLCTVSLSFVITTSVNAATGSDATQIDQSYEHKNKRINRDFNNNFNDPNHVTDDRDNILTDTKNDIKNTTNDILNNNNNGGVNNRTNDGYYRRAVTPTPLANTANANDDDVDMDYGWLGLLGLAGFLGLRRRERVD